MGLSVNIIIILGLILVFVLILGLGLLYRYMGQPSTECLTQNPGLSPGSSSNPNLIPITGSYQESLITNANNIPMSEELPWDPELAEPGICKNISKDFNIYDLYNKTPNNQKQNILY